MTVLSITEAENIGKDIGRLLLNFKKIRGNFKYIKVSIIFLVYILIFYLVLKRSM